eukprot:c18707_g2_i1 orf=285-1178(+)
MGSRTMLSSNNGGAAVPLYAVPSSSLSRQASVYSLTLEEFQNVISDPGKNFGSMNMDELLKNIWTAEESQAMAVAMTSCGAGGVECRTGGIARQPSLHGEGGINLPRTLSRKTVDEVWRDIQRTTEADVAGKQQRRQATFGEMTLEDFLMKAGVVREENDATRMASGNGNGAPSVAAGPGSNLQAQGVQALTAQNLQHPGWFNYAHQQHHQLLQQAEAAALANATKRIGPPSALTLPSNPLYDRLSEGAQLMPGNLAGGLSLSPAATDSPTHGRKRGMPESLFEKSLERRQRRMIKN